MGMPPAEQRKDRQTMERTRGDGNNGKNKLGNSMAALRKAAVIHILCSARGLACGNVAKVECDQLSPM